MRDDAVLRHALPLGRGLYDELRQYDEICLITTTYSKQVMMAYISALKMLALFSNVRSMQWQPRLAACQRKRLRFLWFSFTQRIQCK